MSTIRQRGRNIAAVALGLAVAGCASLFTGEPKHLYRVTPKSTFSSGLAHVSAQLLIDVPTAQAGLDSDRIALTRSPVSLDYFADSQWTDRAPLVVQTALLESFENSRAVVAIDRESAALRADFVLASELRHFEAEYPADPEAPPRVWVTLIVRLIKMPEREIIAQRTVTRQEPASANEIEPIVLAFDEALGAAMKEVVIWTLSNPALTKKPSLPDKPQ
ncbi:MAG: membrane integrity-associated transporter subunit PqiC [Alphaproteobacteria bacterium]|nr:membrane integrity-associated transporter subunit PqiC [Alphaproteobacteria bacterium]